MAPHFQDSRAYSRREFLNKAGMGIGSLALLDLMSREARAAINPLAPAVTPLAPRARAVISLFMHGGPSQVDTFDPKPLLAKYAGQTLPPSFAGLNLEFTKTSTATILASQRTFRNCGQSGIAMSDIFEHLPRVTDELAVVRSCYHTDFNHAPALYMAHSGSRLMGRPSLGLGKSARLCRYARRPPERRTDDLRPRISPRRLFRHGNAHGGRADPLPRQA
jgi:hypothetical protein